MNREELKEYRRVVDRELERMEEEARISGLSREDFVIRRLKEEIDLKRPFTTSMTRRLQDKER